MPRYRVMANRTVYTAPGGAPLYRDGQRLTEEQYKAIPYDEERQKCEIVHDDLPAKDEPKADFDSYLAAEEKRHFDRARASGKLSAAREEVERQARDKPGGPVEPPV